MHDSNPYQQISLEDTKVAPQDFPMRVTKQFPNIAFWGTPPFTLDFLDSLLQYHYTPSLIVTTPDRPVGRGLTLTAPAPKKWGLDHGIEVLQPEKLDDHFYTTLEETPWDIFIVIAYGKILPERIINLPRFGTINIHYSLLPLYRGATPVESAILNGDTETGIMIQQMTFQLDAGDILTQSIIPIEQTDTAHTLRQKLNDDALLLLSPLLDAIFSGTTTHTPQSESGVTLTKKIKKEDGLISLTDSPIVNDRKYRAYVGWPGVYFMAEKNGKAIRVKINKAHLDNDTFIIEEVVPENAKAMKYDVFLMWVNQ